MFRLRWPKCLALSVAALGLLPLLSVGCSKKEEAASQESAVSPMVRSAKARQQQTPPATKP